MLRKFNAIFFVFLNHYVMSQSIFGTIKDKETGELVQYAHISVSGRITGTVSNAEGAFKLTFEKISDLDSLRISHVGYRTTLISSKILKQNEENVIELVPLVVSLNEVVITGKDPFDHFLKVVASSNAKAQYPFSTSVYFREIVKDNNECSKYSDALLRINYPMAKEDMMIGVEQARVVKLPKESDDILLTTSPIDVDKIFKYQYFTFLDRFQGENRNNYNYSIHGYSGQLNKYRIDIVPNRAATKNEFLFSGEIIVENDYISHIAIRMDSTSSWEKSFLGATVKIVYMEVTLSFKYVKGNCYLSFAKNYLNINYSHKKSFQKNEYQSEFIALDVDVNQLKAIEKKQRLKTKTLYKYGDSHFNSFWEGINIPIYSKRESELIEKLKASQLLK
jgi:hypothetical protein